MTAKKLSTGLTVKQEKFCQEFIATGNAGTAYRAAYNAEKMQASTVRSKACELLAVGYITEHIEQLRKKAAERNAVTVDSIISELEVARIAALAAPTPQIAAAVSATMGKAKIAGIEKQLGDADNPYHHNHSIAVKFVDA